MDYEKRVNNLWNRRIQPYESYQGADKMGDSFKDKNHERKGRAGRERRRPPIP